MIEIDDPARRAGDFPYKVTNLYDELSLIMWHRILHKKELDEKTVHWFNERCKTCS